MSHESLPGWRGWGLNILLGLDQLGNALFGGDYTETISSRAGRAWHQGHVWGRWLCAGLNRLDPGHCDHAIKPEATPSPPLGPAERQAILDRLQRLKKKGANEGDQDGV